MTPLLSLAMITLGFAFGNSKGVHSGQEAERRNTTVANPQAVLEVINALGGEETLARIQSFVYHGGEIYRSSSLGQSYNIDAIDQSVAAGGSQTTSFQIEGSGLLTRIDRTYVYDQYWAWAFADLQPAINMSLVAHNAENRYACFVAGTNSFEIESTIPQGYTDGLATHYILHLAHQLALPWLLQAFLANTTTLNQYQVREPHTSAIYNVLESPTLNLALLYDRTTGIPRAIRSFEDHIIYGPSTSDLILTDFRPVAVAQDSNFTLPFRMQTVYNSRFVIEDLSIDSIAINPTFSEDYFEGQKPPPDPKDPFQGLVPVEPQTNIDYPLSEVHEFFESGLWSGPFGEMYNSSAVVVKHPDPAFKNIMQIYVAYPDYVQVLVEHDTGFIITDAPRHRSRIILDWLRKNRPDKNVTHVVPSHHHRDHAGGVEDFLQAGATLVVPHVARNYYTQAKRNNSTYRVITYDDTHPFIFRDGSIEFRSFWSHGNPHAEDWSFAVATQANASDADLFVVFVADVINPGTAALNWENDVARQFFISAIAACVPQSTLLIGAHGSVSGSENNTIAALHGIAATSGFSYPALTAHDWQSCL